MDLKDNTLRLLQEFTNAWNAHDCDALMTMMTEDCVYYSSSGTETFGQKYEGVSEVRAAFENVWRHYPDAQWLNAKHNICGDRGFSEWTFRGTDFEGKPHIVDGVDLFDLMDGKIRVKNTFRKMMR